MTTIAKRLADEFSRDTLVQLFRQKADSFRPREASLAGFVQAGQPFSDPMQLGLIELDGTNTVLVAAVRVDGELTARSSKRQQYDLAKAVTKRGNHNAAIFAFHDGRGRFRLSLVTASYQGTRREFSSFRRYTFFVDPALPNKTFLQQFGRGTFSSLQSILKAFSIEAVSDEFYREFQPKFNDLAQNVAGTDDTMLRQDFALLFVIRVIFLGFVQKKGWLGDNPSFLQGYWDEYRRSGASEMFYKDWLEPLFFEALNNAPGRKVSYGRAPFGPETQDVLQMAPYLNGELFKRKTGVDTLNLAIPDRLIGEFFEFIFQYNFTVEENELFDEELELNPEFLGIIFERITNMDQGAVYTPRVEVTLMCRLALEKWLEQNTEIDRERLYPFVFAEPDPSVEGDDMSPVEFSADEILVLVERLENVTVCDPAAGSGAFEVGMLQVLEQLLERLYAHPNAPAALTTNAPTPFERKKAIIARSLYGVEVKRWAVWINHLRLWLTLFVDMPDEFRHDVTPLLPNLAFKVRVGDSLVQRIGGKTFPVQGHAALPKDVKSKITQLKRKKSEFFYNQGGDFSSIEREELGVFRAILDAEIQARQEEVRNLRGAGREVPLIEFESAPTKAPRGGSNDDRIDVLEAEISELQQQKASLKEERPFIWSIEFAEIFFEGGGFDIIIGNPPYLEKEKIADPSGRLDVASYKAHLLEMVRQDFPDYFAKSQAKNDQFKKGRQPSGRSDLCTYFYIRSLRLVNAKGVHSFICTTSWLETEYGGWLQEFFLRRAPLWLVIDNLAQRSFAQADVNTVITIAGPPQQVTADHVVRFAGFTEPFSSVDFARCFRDAEEATTVECYSDIRVCPVEVGRLLREGARNGEEDGYVSSKWAGQYLRAPDIYFRLLKKMPRALPRLGDVADIREGKPTGANKFFYVSRSVMQRFAIESEYLRPAFMQSKGLAGLELTAEQVDRWLLTLPADSSWRRANVSKYVEYGESEVVPQSKTLSKKANNWWYIPERAPADLLVPCGISKKFWCAINSANAVASNNFCEIIPSSFRARSSILFLLNHPVGWLFLEVLGRPMGEGLLKVDPIEYRQLPYVDLPADFSLPFHRPVGDVFFECGLDRTSALPFDQQTPVPPADRRAFDDTVFSALGIVGSERDQVYRAVCQLVHGRDARARSTRSDG